MILYYGDSCTATFWWKQMNYKLILMTL